MNTLKSFLGAYPVVGLSSSMGGGILPFIIAVNPVLQFMGLCLGIAIGYLTIEAKLAERRERKGKDKI